jgi:hypothetical protein
MYFSLIDMCGSPRLMDHLLSPRIHGMNPLAVDLICVGLPGERQAKGITILAFLYFYYDSTLDLCREVLVDCYMVSLLEAQLSHTFTLNALFDTAMWRLLKPVNYVYFLDVTNKRLFQELFARISAAPCITRFHSTVQHITSLENFSEQNIHCHLAHSSVFAEQIFVVYSRANGIV